MPESSPAGNIRGGLWARAAAAAAATPESRNRYVDFLRALSILAVISGHWLMAAPFVEDGAVGLGNMLDRQPWTRALTWLFQVMPVFFFVGGYSNGVSWSAALRDRRGYAAWLNGRMQRLAGPVLPLVVVWAVLGIVAVRLGLRPSLVKVGSQVALVPIWFLSVYVMAVVLVPVMHRAWKRFGFASFWALVLLAVADDLLFFAAGFRWLGWLNYAFVWLAVHQLGFAWRDGRFTGVGKRLLWAGGGLAVLCCAVFLGPYPLAMVSVPGDEVSNTLPPKLPMLLLGIVQSGLLLAFESPMRRWLRRARPWTATVLVNGMIMTVYLWHLTASTLLVGLAMAAGNVGLNLQPGTGAWWLGRLPWMLVYVAALALFVVVFGRFERGGRGRPAAAWRQVLGAVLLCAGLALLALEGVGGEGFLGVRLWVVLVPLAGAVLAKLNPL